MEKTVRRPVGLTGLFWRYLLAVGAGTAAVSLAWWAVLMLLLHVEFVLPAAYAASYAAETADILSEGFSTETIPYYFRWAIFDRDGNPVDSSGMSGRQLEYARQSLTQGGTSARSFPYDQYHAIAPLPEGGACVLQYDYSMPYRNPQLHRILPDFQLSSLAVLAGLCVLAAGACTRHYTRLLRQDAQTIASATHAIAARQLNEPFSGAANVRELGEALDAMDLLRQNLAEALERQWAMEQQRRRDLTALAHDLKTPLAIISGNGELLAEEPLSDAQRGSVDAILRGAERLGNYVGRLRDFSAGDGVEEETASVALAELFEVWQAAGEDLCVPKGIRFCVQEPPELTLYVRREAVSRAVLNLLDNAARYVGEGGGVVLSARDEGELLAVAVTDTGLGFTAEALAYAGHGLYTSAAARPQDGHMGWGLCYARQVARDHGGELRLRNTGSGAAAEIRLPLPTHQADSDLIG